ncbi:MAG: Mrp/NBP35 family ATP-binding protein [Deltaproteobacteria bacterium]|jgi:Mrp family chromosome partitioning ATPase|nr:Mrp/NBP35 family ATP-binding protein [Deltaproteobacteria bacterium]
MITTLGDLDKVLRRKELAAKLARMGKKYLVMSGKGGVGKTALCSSLALAKAREGQRVGVLDVDFHGPNLAGALFLEGTVEADERGQIIPLKVLPNLAALSAQPLLSDPDEAVLWRGPRKIRAISQFLGDAAWGELDYFFIDTPPGTGDEALAIARDIPDLEALVVTTGHSFSLADAAKAINYLKAAKASVKGVVDSLGSFVCPKCQEEIVIYPPERVASLAAKFSLPVLARVPLDFEAQARSEERRLPLLEAAPESLLARKIRELASLL